MFYVSPSNRVNDRFQDYHSSRPPVEEVVCVEADLEQGNKGVVAASKNNQSNHVANRKRSTSSTKVSSHGILVEVLVVQGQAESGVAEEVKKQKNSVHS